MFAVLLNQRHQEQGVLVTASSARDVQHAFERMIIAQGAGHLWGRVVTVLARQLFERSPPRKNFQNPNLGKLPLAQGTEQGVDGTRSVLQDVSGGTAYE